MSRFQKMAIISVSKDKHSLCLKRTRDTPLSQRTDPAKPAETVKLNGRPHSKEVRSHEDFVETPMSYLPRKCFHPTCVLAVSVSFRE